MICLKLKFSFYTGGGTSDLFSTIDEPTTPRSVKNHMKSNIFATPPNFNNGAGKKKLFLYNPLLKISLQVLLHKPSSFSSLFVTHSK